MGMMISLVSIHDGKMGMVIDFGGYEGYKEMRVVSWAGMKVGVGYSIMDSSSCETTTGLFRCLHS